MGRELANRRHGYEFSGGSSGPFGEDLGGMAHYDSARKTLLFHQDPIWAALAKEWVLVRLAWE